MSKRILVLTGSPRKDGNSDKLADGFIAGAERAGHTVMKYSTADKDIKGCLDCQTCFQRGSACSVPDAFVDLAPLVQQADMIVFATPMYWFSFPAKLKAAIDKFYAFLTSGTPLNIRQCALLVTGGVMETDRFDGIVQSYQRIAEFMSWHNCGVVIVPGLHGKNDILQTDGLQRAEILGRSIF